MIFLWLLSAFIKFCVKSDQHNCSTGTPRPICFFSWSPPPSPPHSTPFSPPETMSMWTLELFLFSCVSSVDWCIWLAWLFQGPEHSSCRIERFLQMSNDDPEHFPVSWFLLPLRISLCFCLFVMQGFDENVPAFAEVEKSCAVNCEKQWKEIEICACIFVKDVFCSSFVLVLCWKYYIMFLFKKIIR